MSKLCSCFASGTWALLCETRCPSAFPSFSWSLVNSCAIVCAVRDGDAGHAVVSRSFAPSSVSAWISTRSAVCPWLEWLVTAYAPCRSL